MLPGMAIMQQRLRVRQAFLADNAFQCIEPMAVIRGARIRIAGSLRPLYLVSQHGRPFRPAEDSAFLQRNGHGEGMRLPGRAKDRPVIVARNPGHGLGSESRGLVTPARCMARTRQWT